ncbi:uncharacterized protein LJ206_020637 [Theristicus caerulescens]
MSDPHLCVRGRHGKEEPRHGLEAGLFQGKAEGGTAVWGLMKREQWSELTEAVREHVEVKKLLRNKLQRLQERRECLREPRAFRGKTAQAEETGESLLQEMAAVRLKEQLVSRRHKIASWLRTLCLLWVGLQLAVGFALAAAVLYASWYDPELLRFLLFLAFLQIAVLILVLLKRDILNWVLPAKLAAAFGSPPARPRFF